MANSGADFEFPDDDEITRILGKNNDPSAKSELTGSSLCRFSPSYFSGTHVGPSQILIYQVASSGKTN